MDMSEADLIARLAAAVAQHLVPEAPLSSAVWRVEEIAKHFKVSADTVKRLMVVLPSFPKPMRLPISENPRPRWKAREVIAWGERQS